MNVTIVVGVVAISIVALNALVLLIRDLVRGHD